MWYQKQSNTVILLKGSILQLDFDVNDSIVSLQMFENLNGSSSWIIILIEILIQFH